MLDRRISYDPAFASDTITNTDAFSVEAPALRRRPVYSVAKRALDVILSLLALTALTPVFLAVAIAIKLDSRGPVFYRQTRLGKDSKAFTMFKFRSMLHRPIDLPPELLAQNESTGPLFKMRNDPRVTRVGRLIRRASVDELPQLINVLVGQMSLVGPRPPLPREFEGFEAVQCLRLRVVPGVTGPWQVSGRSNLPFEEMVRLDLGYIEQRSLLLDLKLLVLTVPTVMLGRGAY